MIPVSSNDVFPVLTEQRFVKLTAALEQEQESNQKRLHDLAMMQSRADTQESEVRTFIKEIRRYATIEELDEAVLNRLIHLNRIKAANRTARHNVYAYVLREGGRTRYSDDGEPAKTAGTPVLEASGHAGLSDVIVVVTRYFGGVLLGTGGLVRAYTAAASGALQQAEIVSMRLVTDCAVTVPYPKFEQAQRMIAAAGAKLQEPEYADAVTLRWRMPAGTEEALCHDLSELTRGSAEVTISKPLYAAF